jgi:hypothetical protein
MKLLLTSAGITNTSIHDALVDLLGKPIAESSALFIPTAIYPFRGGAGRAWQLISKGSLCELGWKSLGVLESKSHASAGVIVKCCQPSDGAPALAATGSAVPLICRPRLPPGGPG